MARRMAVIPVRVSKPGRSLLSMKINTDTDEFKFIPTMQGLQVMGTLSVVYGYVGSRCAESQSLLYTKYEANPAIRL